MQTLQSIDSFLEQLKNPDSGYFGAAASFMFASAHAAYIRNKFFDGSQDSKEELLDFIGSGIHAFRMDDEVFAKENSSAEELSVWIDQYSYFAARMIGWGQDMGDRMFIYPSLCIADAISAMEERLSKLSGDPANPYIDQALMPLDATDKTVAKELYSADLSTLLEIEIKIGLCLFHKILIRRSRFKKEPPIHIGETLEEIETILDRALEVPVEPKSISSLAKRAGICYRDTKSTIRSDYLFVDRILTALSKELAR